MPFNKKPQSFFKVQSTNMLSAELKRQTIYRTCLCHFHFSLPSLVFCQKNVSLKMGRKTKRWTVDHSVLKNTGLNRNMQFTTQTHVSSPDFSRQISASCTAAPTSSASSEAASPALLLLNDTHSCNRKQSMKHMCRYRGKKQQHIRDVQVQMFTLITLQGMKPK